MAQRLERGGVAAAAIAMALALATPAEASTAIEYPDNGTAQFSRGGAWLATATDPIAGYFNPAALATQPSSFGIGANLVRQKICFTRLGVDGAEVGPDPTDPTLTYPTVCNQKNTFFRFIPNLAFVYRAHEKVAFGLTVVPPASFGKVGWDRTVTVTTTNEFGTFEQQIAPPQRFLSLGVQGTILYPTASVGVELFKGFRVGAGFVFGFADLRLDTASMGSVSVGDELDDFRTDTRSTFNVTDPFIPGVVASIHYSATKNLDFALWYKWFDDVTAFGKLQVRAPAYGSNIDRGTVVRDDCETPEESELPDSVCAGVTEIPEKVAPGPEGGKSPRFELAIPQELRFGVRYHEPYDKSRATPLEAEAMRKGPYPDRDPLRDDKWDIEINLTWADNSESDQFTVRFPDNPAVNVVGSPGGQVPPNADRPTGFKDSFGVRLGGQVAAIQNKMGVRYGTWIETPAVKDEDLTVTGVPSLRGGVGGGLVFRVHHTDIEFGYQRIWNKGLNNGGACIETTDADPIENQSGCGRLTAIAGSGSQNDELTFENRSYVGVNGGKVTQKADVFAVGVVARF